MTIKIDNTTTIRKLQKKFSAIYPFLKIEFSDTSHEEGELTEKGHWYDPSFRLGDIAKKPIEGFLIIQPWHKTGYVEELFRNRYGLYPQIFRKENDKWIQTAGTDIFTLDEQNEIGRRIVEKSRSGYYKNEMIL